MAVVLTDTMTGFGTDFESLVDFEQVFETELDIFLTCHIYPDTEHMRIVT